MFRKLVMIVSFLFSASVYAQEWMPDVQLQEVVRETLQLSAGDELTQQSMGDLKELHAQRREIRDLSGLEFAINLEVLFVFGNPVSDLSPISKLSLIVFNAGGCQITDISPLESMLTLEYLFLHINRIHDITPLLNLKNLKELTLLRNPISDYTLLKQLESLGSLEWYDWGKICEVPNIPIQDRIDNKTYPAIFNGWSAILNQPNLTELDMLSKFDLSFCCPYFGLAWIQTSQGWKLSGDIQQAIARRKTVQDQNSKCSVFDADTLLFSEIGFASSIC